MTMEHQVTNYVKEPDGSHKVSGLLNVLNEMTVKYQMRKHVKERYGSHKGSALQNVIYNDNGVSMEEICKRTIWI